MNVYILTDLLFFTEKEDFEDEKEMVRVTEEALDDARDEGFETLSDGKLVEMVILEGGEDDREVVPSSENITLDNDSKGIIEPDNEEDKQDLPAINKGDLGVLSTNVEKILSKDKSLVPKDKHKSPGTYTFKLNNLENILRERLQKRRRITEAFNNKSKSEISAEKRIMSESLEKIKRSMNETKVIVKDDRKMAHGVWEESKRLMKRTFDYEDKVADGWIQKLQDMEDRRKELEIYEKELKKAESEGVLNRKRGRPKKSNVECKKVKVSEEEFEEETERICYVMLTRISADPDGCRQAMSSIDHLQWKEAVESELQAMHKNNAWELVDRPTSATLGKPPNIIDSRRGLKKKVDDSGNIKHKARLVVRGCKDRNFYSVKETYAPVSRLTVVRAIFAIANKFDMEVCHLDVKTAFLNGDISEEIYMEIPEGVHRQIRLKERKVCKLKKALYGLKISPKKWNQKFVETAEKIGLKADDDEPYLFTCYENEVIVILLLYVDDMLIVSNDTSKLNEIKVRLMSEFEMMDLGAPNEFLGVKVKRDRNSHVTTLTQTKYIEKMLEKFGFSEMKPQNTPMATNHVNNVERRKRENDHSGDEGEVTKLDCPYREAVGSLLYLANATRPDISYAVNVLSRHQIDPTEEDWNMVKRVFRYLKGTKGMGLIYRGKIGCMEAYSDASFADCKGSLTTSGYLIRLYGDTIGWRTHRQASVALSTCQAEYVALSEACQELMSVHNSLKLMLEESKMPMTVWCDNTEAIINAETLGNGKLRHISERREHYVKECVRKEYVTVKKVGTRDQLADIFTKPLAYIQHNVLTLGILNVEC